MKEEATIAVRGLKSQARLGCTEAERAFPQVLLIDLKMLVNVSECIKSDSISDAVDYAAVMETTDGYLRTTEWKLLEKLAADLAHHLLTKFPLVSQLELTIDKSVLPNSRAFQVRYAKSRTTA